jgi:hypothetical protein
LNFSVSAIVVFGLPLYYKSLTLYSQDASKETGNRNDRIRTYGHSLPKRVLYQTELHSVVVVPIAANPELPRGSPQLSCISTRLV